MKERFMKNGVFSLEYDKETLRDMVLEKQEEIQKQKEAIDKAIKYIEKCLEQTPTENREKTDDILDMEYKYILDILKGSDSNE